MNCLELKGEIARHGLSVPKLAELLKMSKKTLYSRLNGETPFTQPEIKRISEILHLNDEGIMRIFFNQEVA